MSEAKTNPEVAPVSRAVVANLADRLAKSGNTLGVELKVLSEGPISSKVNSKPIDRRVATDMDAMNVRLQDVAGARAEQEAGSAFIGKYGRAGLMMASKEFSNKAYLEHMDRISKATPRELQFIARANARAYTDCVNEEAGLRLDQAVVNHPDLYAKRLLDTSGGKTVEGNRAVLVEEFKKLDFNKQRDVSMRDGMPVLLSDGRGRYMKSVKLGFAAIENELKARGLRVEVTLNGRDNVARETESKTMVEAANAATAPNRSRRSRDGVSL